MLTSPNFIAYTRRYDYVDRSKLIVSALDYRNMHLLIQADPPSAQLITYYPQRHTVKFVDYSSARGGFPTGHLTGRSPPTESVCRPRR